jgi:hypothetical protein
VKTTAFQPIKSGLSSFDKKPHFFTAQRNFFCNDLWSAGRRVQTPCSRFRWRPNQFISVGLAKTARWRMSRIASCRGPFLQGE